MLTLLLLIQFKSNAITPKTSSEFNEEKREQKEKKNNTNPMTILK